jgi:hypothetical protein
MNNKATNLHASTGLVCQNKETPFPGKQEHRMSLRREVPASASSMY